MLKKQPVALSRNSMTIDRDLKIIGQIQIFCGFLHFFTPLIKDTGFDYCIIRNLLAVISILLGYRLYEGAAYAISCSAILQAIQIPIIKSQEFNFTCYVGIDLSLSYNAESILMGVNIFALILLAALLRYKKDLEIITLINQLRNTDKI